MGQCKSVHSSSTSGELPTAKIVTAAGDLLQYSVAVTAADALLSLEPAVGGSFLCSSDALVFNKPAPALRGTERLQLGQIYFALPKSMMRRPLAPAEIGALAARAAAALMSSEDTEESRLNRRRRGVKRTKFCRRKIFPVADGGDMVGPEKPKKYDDVRSRQSRTKLSIIYEG